jgi:hypothetical protein
MKLFRFVLLGLCLVLLSLPAFAQDTETVEWGDTGIFVDYPSDFEVDDSGENAALILFTDDIYVKFYEPWTDFEDAEQAMEAISTNEDYEFDDIEDFEILGDDGFRMDYTSDDYAGFVVTFMFDDTVHVMEGFVVDDRISSSEEDTILEIVSSLHTDGEDDPQPSGDAIESAQDEDASGEDIVAELVELELVADDGDFLFEEDEVVDATDLPESYEGGDIAMGAWISWEAVDDDEEYRFCTLVAQSSTDDLSEEEGTALVVGIGNDNLVLVAEFDLENFDDSIIETFEADVDVEDENHFLAIVSDDELSIFVNGEAVVEGWELDLTAGDDEFSTGFISDLGCTMTNVWAYTFEN